MATVPERIDKEESTIPTRHYAIERWIDYARGLEPPEEALLMKSHAASCGECSGSMRFCEKLTAVARCAIPRPGSGNT